MGILRAKEKDSQILAKIFNIFYKSELRWSEEKIRNNIIKSKYEYYIYLDKVNTPVGAISLHFNKGICELEAIAVITQKSGYGSRLIKFAESLAKTRNCIKIWCYSLELYQAGDFYKKIGWNKEEFIPLFWDGQNCFKYSKLLS